MKLKVVQPSPSYQLAVPEEVSEDHDGRTNSFWIPGGASLLQLSSYLRSTGEQISAADRLQDRISKTAADWQLWSTSIYPDSSADQATAEFVDERQGKWVYTYIVWSHLTILAVISGPKTQVDDAQNWALKALRTVKLTVQ
jgi:hypothetical protein